MRTTGWWRRVYSFPESPARPRTPVDDENLAKMENRLALFDRMSDFDIDMKPALANALWTMVLQDMPALIEYVKEARRA